MDITAFISAFELAIKAISLFKKAKDSLPNGKEKEAIEKSLDEAERAFKFAELKAAQEFGYHLCKCTWPPQIMLSMGYEEYGENFKCPKCGDIWPGEESPPLRNWRLI